MAVQLGVAHPTDPAAGTQSRTTPTHTEPGSAIKKCATEARLIDESLRKERDDARTAKQREELHAKLSGMLYGIAASPDATTADSSAADAVMARVQAYRDIRNQIQQVQAPSDPDARIDP